ncbi:hypothetical protein ASD76_06905 [Altererythrobacter sp. Root672]|nr:hypothetical protein ASD76_06905 [Altererythrobacter sp. Root672]
MLHTTFGLLLIPCGALAYLGLLASRGHSVALRGRRRRALFGAGGILLRSAPLRRLTLGLGVALYLRARGGLRPASFGSLRPALLALRTLFSAAIVPPAAILCGSGNR